MNDLTIIDALGYSLLGICIVFVMLVALMIVIFVLPKIIGAFSKKETTSATTASAAAAPAAPAVDPNAGKIPAEGSLGDIKLHNVSDKTAALVMAIVADEMKEELNTLRFISIKEIG